MSLLSSRALATAAVALALVAAGNGIAHAQGQGLKLQRSLGAPPSGREGDLPTFVTADRIEGLGEFEVEASGNAELRRGDTSLLADRIRYSQDVDEAEATGNVRLYIGGDEIQGPRLRLRLADTAGIFESPTYRLAPRTRGLRTGVAGPQLTASDPAPQIFVESRGSAKALRFDGEDRYRVTDGTYTTCKPGQDDWFFEAREFDLDLDREVGTARNARLTFFGVSTPRLPWFDFSLNNQRKTGFLLPTFGIQNRVGTQIALPFYWNIAPNYDATITTRYMQQRGVQFQNEFRFLHRWFVGDARYEYLPNDQVFGDSRYAVSLNANWNLQNGWSGLLNHQRVSDDNYFRDLSTQLSVATQAYLPQDTLVNYGSPTGWWTAGLRVQRFQTLQDPQNRLPEPYFREPQFTLNVLKQAVGADLAFQGEFVDFTSTTLAPTGRRLVGYPSVALPLLATYGFITPKIGLHTTQYNLRALGGFVDRSLSRTLPIASIESGLFFERDVDWFGGDFVQTLEPRVFYLRVPFKDQSNLPVFDTGTADLNFSQLFQENLFVGNDRIANANQLSVAVTSRLIRQSDGQELLRAIVGQRYYFEDQKVFIPGQPVRTESESPIMFGLAGRIAPNWTAEAGVQYRAINRGSIEKLNTGVRYSPAPASVASVSYRYTAQNLTAGTAAINGIDVAAQWPLGAGFYGLGRYSYDLEGRKRVESLFGLEYNAGCWIVRAVAHQFQTATAQETTAFYVQLEFNGFARIGSNPLDVLRRNIPGYSLINQAMPENRPSDFGPMGAGTSSPSAGPARPIPGAPDSAYRTYQ